MDDISGRYSDEGQNEGGVMKFIKYFIHSFAEMVHFLALYLFWK